MNLMTRKLIPVFAFLLVGLSACSLAADVTPPPGYQPTVVVTQTAIPRVYPLTAPDPSQGAAIYAEKCTPCHGVTGKGDGKQAPSSSTPVTAIGSSNEARVSIPAEWYQIISQGSVDGFMPGFSSILNDRQRWDGLAYVYSLSVTSDEMAQGAGLYADQCVACHGPTGKGGSAPSLVDPATTYQQPMMMTSAVIRQGNGDMPAFSNLSEDQVWALAGYLRSLSFVSSNSLVASTPVPAVAGTPVASFVPTATLAGNGTAAAGETSTPAVTPTTIGMGRVTGKITNGSGGSIPLGLKVTLLGYDNMAQVSEMTTLAKSDGSYSFNDVDMPDGRVFLAKVTVEDVPFNSDVAHSSQPGTVLDLPITIYHASTDASVLSADRLHIFFDFSNPGTVQVVELYVVSNPTDKVITGKTAQDPVLTFDLPYGATSLQFQDGQIGDRYTQTDKGFGDRNPVPPGNGQYQVLFAFNMPYDKSLNLKLPVSLPVQAVIVMVQDVGLKLKSAQLTSAGSRDVQGMNFQVYNGANLTQGGALDISLSGRVKTSTETAGVTQSSSTGLLIGLSVLAGAIIGAGIWFVRRRKAPDGEDEEDGDIESTEEAGNLPEDVDALLDAIAALDDLYRAGTLPQEAYQQRRVELKNKLAKLI